MKMLADFNLLSAVTVLLMMLVALSQESFQSEEDSHEIHERGKCGCVCGHQRRHQRIVGGGMAKPSEFPWIATLTHAGTFYCGGILITDRHVLTAAHCLYGRKGEDITVTLGEHKRNEKWGRVVSKVKSMSMHQNFSLAKIQHDIAVIELSARVNITGARIRAACLPTKHEVGANYSGLTGVVAGWGRVTENSATSQALRKVSLPLITVEQCKKMGYPSYRITRDVFCAGYTGGSKDACQGDSGGPLQIKRTPSGPVEVIGIVSWGRGCGRPNYPGVYTRIDRYLGWIGRNIGGHHLCNRPGE